MRLSNLWGRPSFDPEKVDWLFRHFSWLLANYGGHESFLKSYHLVIANQNDFPRIPLTSHKNIQGIFRAIMRHMGMGNWEVRLVEMGSEDETEDWEFEPDRSGLSMEYSADGTAGYFQLDSTGTATIAYGSHLRSDFASLVSVLSHEASHYLLTKSITVMPGGWKDLEPVTDLTAIFTGFGLFQANTASVVNHYAGGTSSANSGYLPESGRAYALAIFTELSLLDPKYVAKNLRANPRASYRAAIKDLRENHGEKMRELESLTPLREW